MIRPLLARAKHSAACLVTLVLAVVLLGLTLAVLLQAAALLVVALLGAAVLLPHPPEWYAARCASALRLFFTRLMAGEAPGREEDPRRCED
ncbi:MAG: hypothetical protein MJ061_03200 [Mailhella sp.]|nr:hypothetical protein [Mailhella sp.]